MDEEENTMMPGADTSVSDDTTTDTSDFLGEEKTSETEEETPEAQEEDTEEEDELPSMAAPSSE